MVSQDRDRQWAAYAAHCREMEAFESGYFYPTGSAPQLYQDYQYRHDYSRVMERHVAAAFPELYRNAWHEVVAGAFGFPLVRRVVEALAKSSAEIVDARPINAEDGTEIVGYRVTAGGDSVATEWADLVRTWPRRFEASDLPEAMALAEKRGELLKGCFAWPRVVDGQVLTDVLSPYRVIAEEYERAPRRLDLAEWVEVPLRGSAAHATKEGALRVRYRHDRRPPPGEPPWQVEVIDPDGNVVDDYRVYGDGDGNPADIEATARNGENLIGAFPVVAWYAEPPTHGIYPEPDWALHRAQIGINLWLIELNEAFLLGSSGLWYDRSDAEGIDPDTNLPVRKKRTLSLRNIWSIAPGDEPPGRLDARVKMAELMDAVERRLKLEAIARNLPPSVFDTNRIPANYSGQSRLVERSDLELARARRERMIARNMERLVDMWARVSQFSAQPLPAPYSPERVQWKVLLRSLPPDTFDQSAAQAAEAMSRLGVEPPWRWVELLERLHPSEAIGRTRYYRSFVDSPPPQAPGPAAATE